MGWLSAVLKTGATLGAGAINPFAGAAVGSAIGAMDEQNRIDEIKRQNRNTAAVNKYSALTGRWGKMKDTHANMLAAATKGGLGGYEQGQSTQDFMANNPNMFSFGPSTAAIQGAPAIAQQGGGAWQQLLQQNPTGLKQGSPMGSNFITPNF